MSRMALALHLDGLVVDPRVDIVQLAVQGVKGGPFGALWSPTLQHHAVDIGRTALRTWQPVP